MHGCTERTNSMKHKCLSYNSRAPSRNCTQRERTHAEQAPARGTRHPLRVSEWSRSVFHLERQQNAAHTHMRAYRRTEQQHLETRFLSPSVDTFFFFFCFVPLQWWLPLQRRSRRRRRCTNLARVAAGKRQPLFASAAGWADCQKHWSRATVPSTGHHCC